MAGPGTFALWLRATRPFSFTASLLPVALGGLWAFREGPINWLHFALAIIAGLLFHMGTNLVNDYFDFKKGVDREGTYGSSGVLVAGLMKPAQILRGGLIAFGIGSAIGVYLVTQAGLPILILGIVGFLGGFLYTAAPVNYKYFAVGEFGVFLMMGVLMTLGGYLVRNRPFNWEVVIFSLPISFLVAAILQANDIRDIEADKEADITTMAMATGRDTATFMYDFMIVAAFITVVGMVVTTMLSPWGLLVFLTLPLGLKNISVMHKTRNDGPTAIATMDVNTAQLHMTFGLLLCLGVILGRVL